MNKGILLHCLFILLLTIVLTVEARSRNVAKDREKLQKLAGKLEKSFAKEHKKFKTSGVTSRKYEKMLEHLRMTPSTFRKHDVDEAPVERQDITCLMCRAVVNTFLDYRRVEQYDDEDMVQEGIDLCTTMNLQPEQVCEGLIRLHMASNQLLGSLDC